ncbi:MAG: DUF1284 domain-containing protein [Faecousia sp.]
MSIYRLRAHHGMCLPFFRGAGYSGAFVENMTRMKGILEENPTICLMDSADDICAACPNRLEESCAEKASRYDREVLSRCGLSAGQQMPYRDFSRQVVETILRPGKREEICGDCQWSSLCRWEESK